MSQFRNCFIVYAFTNRTTVHFMVFLWSTNSLSLKIDVWFFKQKYGELLLIIKVILTLLRRSFLLFWWGPSVVDVTALSVWFISFPCVPLLWKNAFSHQQFVHRVPGLPLSRYMQHHLQLLSSFSFMWSVFEPPLHTRILVLLSTWPFPISWTNNRSFRKGAARSSPCPVGLSHPSRYTGPMHFSPDTKLRDLLHRRCMAAWLPPWSYGSKRSRFHEGNVKWGTKYDSLSSVSAVQLC